MGKCSVVTFAPFEEFEMKHMFTHQHIQSVLPEVISLRHQLHKIAELSGYEKIEREKKYGKKLSLFSCMIRCLQL